MHDTKHMCEVVVGLYCSIATRCIYIKLQVVLDDTWLPFNKTNIEDEMRTHFNDLAVTPCSPFDINKFIVVYLQTNITSNM